MPENSLIDTREYAATDPQAVPRALRALRSGELVVLPTDTVYGVGCDLWQVGALELLYQAKRRPLHMAIPVLVSHPRHVAQVARALPPRFAAVAERFWPGGLTLIVPRRPKVPDILCAGGPTVAVRMPDHPLALALIEAMGGALAVTSANRSGHPAPTTASGAIEELRGRVSIVIDGGECPGGVASSIVNLVSDPPVLVRQGHLSADVLAEVIAGLVVASGS